jgi:hypothetical protein
MQTKQNPEFITSISLSPKEFYAFRLLALNNQVQFTVEWNGTGAVVHCEVPFLIAYGYVDKIDF